MNTYSGNHSPGKTKQPYISRNIGNDIVDINIQIKSHLGPAATVGSI